MLVNTENETIYIKESGETLTYSISGLTKKEVKHLSRKIQIDFLEGKRDSLESSRPAKKKRVSSNK